MSMGMPEGLSDLEQSFSLKFDIIEMIKGLLNSGIKNLDSLSDPIYDYTKKISSSMTSTTLLTDDALPHLHIYSKYRYEDIDYIEFIQKIQKDKMKELWDNDEDEVWENV